MSEEIEVVEVKEEESITIDMFKMWLSGVEEMQRAGWHPSQSQWQVIRAKINQLKAEPPAKEVVKMPFAPPGFRHPTEPMYPIDVNQTYPRTDPNVWPYGDNMGLSSPMSDTSGLGVGAINPTDYAERAAELNAEAEAMRSLDEKMAQMKKDGI